jgi:hypothetical protein
MPADAFNNWLTETTLHPADVNGNGKASEFKSAPAPIARGAVDLGGLTVAAPEQ